MKRKLAHLIIVSFIAVATTATLSMSHGKMPDVITIDGAQASKAPVVFPHEKHAHDIKCVICHHTASKEEEANSCFECHGKDSNAPDPSLSSQSDNPFHILCKGCHKENGKGPTKCSECHKE